jgi:hypothetical protein
MSSAIESQLNETFRDALVGYYLSEVVPNHVPIQNLNLNDKLKTPNDLYEFLLLDVQVSQGVETSYVASAISSLQQYINAILMGMEPGYSEHIFNENQLAEWRDQRSQYPIWAANQKLLYYPEIYIDPTLRLKKSSYFQQLETDINQNKIEVDTVQDAVKAYLSSFEEVANLSIINGYIDSNDFATGTYYFIGKSRAENQYYWRSVNMNDRAYLSGMDGPKSDFPNPGAWSDWKKASIGVSGSTLEHTIRPVYFNNRLFMTWVDIAELDDVIAEDGEITLVKAGSVKLQMYVCYKKYDDSWSAPVCYIDEVVAASDLDDSTDSIAVVSNFHVPQVLFLGVFSKKKAAEEYSYWKIISIDKNFKSSVPESNADTIVVQRMFSVFNKGRLQFQVDASLVVDWVKEGPQLGEEFDWEGLSEIIGSISKAWFSYNASSSRLKFTFHINESVGGGGGGYSARMKLTGREAGQSRELAAKFQNLVPTSVLDYTLGKGSEVQREPDRNTPESFSLNTNIGGFNSVVFYYAFRNSPRLDISGKLISMQFKNAFSQPETLNFRLDTELYDVESLQFYSDDTMEVRLRALYPLDMKSPGSAFKEISRTGWHDGSSSGTNLTVSVGVNQATALPVWDCDYNDAGTFYVYYGFDLQRGGVAVGRAYKTAEIKLVSSPPVADEFIAPQLFFSKNSGLGVAEYIDFTGSTIQKSDGSEADRKPIRMNTLFARELVQKANIALESLLSWDTQKLQEPDISDGRAIDMDFHGANGLYFWELFLHLPLMIAQRLNLERQYDQSDHWLGFIFAPTRKKDSSGRPDYWNVRPLEEDSLRDYELRMPVDPDGQASSNPVIYKKAVYGFYIKNLLDRGDSAYRQLTPDSLTEAKLWYVRVLDLLGPRPDTTLVNDWAPITLQALSASSSEAIRLFEGRLVGQAEQAAASGTDPAGRALVNFRQPPLQLSTFNVDPSLRELDNPHFRLPINAELVKHWDTAESRLYNLRHNLTLDGKPMNLPLFAAPLDPRALLAAFANGGAGGGIGSLLGQDIPHYRFAVMHGQAGAAVETLIQFGGTLLSLVERKEQSELQELQQQQMWDFAQFGIELQEQTQRLEAESRNALLTSQKIADARAVFYDRLADEGVSAGEQSVSGLRVQERIYSATAGVSGAIAQGMKVAPNVFGFANGGHRIEGISGSVSVAATTMATGVGISGDILERTEMFRRRQQEWELARDQALLESDQINAQLKIYDEQARLTAIQLRQAKIAFDQARVNHEFLNKRFTKSQLYQWLNGQMSSFYYQAYDATMSLCLAAEACWQFERADFSTRFVRPSAWNDTYRGLLAGESLKLDLLKMSSAYLKRNERLLEIVKTVSVRQLPASSEEYESINTGWEDVVTRLNEEGCVDFEITQAMLDDDYPNQYLRRIKRISVSLPVTVGPYQDIRSILTQTYSAVHLTAGADVSPRENLRASQQIAVSTGVDDDGLFVFNFDDERYLPFEGTGAISRWKLEFPNPDAQREMIESITDIIVHIRYTAKSGSPASRGLSKAPATSSKRKKS